MNFRVLLAENQSASQSSSETNTCGITVCPSSVVFHKIWRDYCQKTAWGFLKVFSHDMLQLMNRFSHKKEESGRCNRCSWRHTYCRGLCCSGTPVWLERTLFASVWILAGRDCETPARAFTDPDGQCINTHCLIRTPVTIRTTCGNVPDVEVTWLSRVFRIREIPSSNLGPKADYRELGVSCGFLHTLYKRSARVP